MNQIIFQILLLCACLTPSVTFAMEKAPPDKWATWVKKRQESYQKTYSAPTITHHVYLNKVGDKADINLQARYPRFIQKKCDSCIWEIKRVALKKLELKNNKTTKKQTVEFGKEVFLKDEKNVLVSAYHYPESNEVRVFLHDMGQKKLKQKRIRSFYDYNKKFVHKTQFHWVEKKKTAIIQRSDGSKKNMPVVAELRYNLEGKPGTLSVYNYEGTGDGYKKSEATMLLFRDLSNGKKTYGAGRFLTVYFPKKMGELKNGDQVMLDFNYSYNPPCAVSTGYHCPLPQDIVNSQVLVGEKYIK